MTKIVKISLIGMFALGLFSSLAAFAQTAMTASLTLTGGAYTNTTSVTTATGTAFTYNWSSTNAIGGKANIQISKGGSSVASDACGNLSGDFSSAINGISGSLGPVTIASCEAGYTYTITYSVTNSSGQTVLATPVVINVIGGTTSGTTTTTTGSCSTNYSTYVAPPTQYTTAILPNFPPFSIVTMDSYMAQTVQGDLSNPSAYLKNPLPNGIPAKANIISDMIQLVNNRCNFYPSICAGIDQTAMGTKYGNILITNLQAICAAPYGTGLTGSVYDNYNGVASTGGTTPTSTPPTPTPTPTPTSTPTNPGTGGTGGPSSGGTLGTANNALAIELQDFSSQLAGILSQLSGSALNSTDVTALTNQVTQITQLVSGLGTGIASGGTGGTTYVVSGGTTTGTTGGTTPGSTVGTTNGGPAVYPTATSPVSVTVLANLLNVRSAPSLSASIVATLSKGQTVSVTGAVMGDMVSGENFWWTTGTGTYIWAGGTSEQPNPSSVASG